MKILVDELKKFMHQEILSAKRSILYDIEQKINMVILKVSQAQVPCQAPEQSQPWKILGGLPFQDLDSFIQFDEDLKDNDEKQSALVSVLFLWYCCNLPTSKLLRERKL